MSEIAGVGILIILSFGTYFLYRVLRPAMVNSDIDYNISLFKLHRVNEWLKKKGFDIQKELDKKPKLSDLNKPYPKNLRNQIIEETYGGLIKNGKQTREKV